MNVENFFKPPQEGGPTEEETMKFKDSLIEKGKLGEKATLSDLVKYVRKEQSSSAKNETVLGKLNRQMKEGKTLPAYGYAQREAKGGKVKKKKKAKKGYVKKYAKGGGVRKVRA